VNDKDRGPESEPTALEPLPPTPADVAALKAERDDLKDQLLRRRADFENYRKRVERDRQQTFQDALADTVKALIPTLDNLDRAQSPKTDEAALREGLALIRRELLVTLEGVGLKVQDPVGERYDPELHEALSHDVVPGAKEGTIVEVFRKGYFLKDRLLRPALVKVAKGTEAGEDGKAVH